MSKIYYYLYEPDNALCDAITYLVRNISANTFSFDFLLKVSVLSLKVSTFEPFMTKKGFAKLFLFASSKKGVLLLKMNFCEWLKVTTQEEFSAVSLQEEL